MSDFVEASDPIPRSRS